MSDESSSYDYVTEDEDNTTEFVKKKKCNTYMVTENKINEKKYDLTAVKTIRFRKPSINILVVDFVKFTGLKYLYIHNQNVKDISPVSVLYSLECLYAADNQIEDISSLCNLKLLTDLNIENNNVNDISSLEFLNIKILNISSNNIEDISVLFCMTGMTELDISSNKVKDISVLKNMNKLRVLYADNNQIEDVSVLKDKPELSYTFLLTNYKHFL